MRGIAKDPAAIAGPTIRRAGQNGGRAILCQEREVQRRADAIGRLIALHRFPPGPREWTKIEPCLVSPRITVRGWPAKPLLGDRLIVALSAPTTGKTGLKVCRELDPNSPPKGSGVAIAELASRTIPRADFPGSWNATIAASNQALQTKR